MIRPIARRVPSGPALTALIALALLLAVAAGLFPRTGSVPDAARLVSSPAGLGNGIPGATPDCGLPTPAQQLDCVGRYAAERSQAELNLRAAQAELGRVPPGAPEAELARSQAAVDAAVIAVDAAERRLSAARLSAGR
jgi:hypothetical protein